MHAITLKAWDELSETQQSHVADIRISNTQVEYAGTVARAITACRDQAGPDLCGVTLLLGEHPVGFMVVRRAAALPTWAPADAAVVGGLRLDIDYQGMGLGQKALGALPGWLLRRWPGIERIVLRVDDDNAAGIRAYEKAGWVETGPRSQGRIGIERTLERWLVPLPTTEQTA